MDASSAVLNRSGLWCSLQTSDGNGACCDGWLQLKKYKKNQLNLCDAKRAHTSALRTVLLSLFPSLSPSLYISLCVSLPLPLFLYLSLSLSRDKRWTLIFCVPVLDQQAHKLLDREKEYKWQGDLATAKQESARHRLDFERQVGQDCPKPRTER